MKCTEPGKGDQLTLGRFHDPPRGMIAHTIIDVSEKGLVSRDRLAGLGDAAAAVPGVVFAYLFGSVALGDDGPLSDVDLAVYLDDTVDPSETRLAVIEAASRHLRTDRVDVVVLNSAPIALAGRVLASRRVVLDRQPFLRHRYESLTHREFSDFRLLERRHFARRYGRG